MKSIISSRMRWVLSVLAISFIEVSAAKAEDWPCFRGPGRQGISQEKNLPTQWSATTNIRWKTPIPGEGWSSPIVFGDQVFVTTAVDKGTSLHLICLSRATGKIAWDKELTQQELKYKQQPNSYATSTPVTDGRMVYVVVCDGRILAADMDGKVAWTNSEFDYYSQHGLAVSPVLYEDLVIVPFDWSSPGPNKSVGWQTPWDKAVILAVDKNTGNTRWKGSRSSSQIAHVTPQIAGVDGRDQLVSGAGGVVQGFNLKTGERLWTVSSPGEGVVPSVVAGDGMAFTASGFGEETILAVRLGGSGDITQTHVVWRVKDDVPHVPSMLYVSPRLYSITEAGTINCRQAPPASSFGASGCAGRSPLRPSGPTARSTSSPKRERPPWSRRARSSRSWPQMSSVRNAAPVPPSPRAMSSSARKRPSTASDSRCHSRVDR